MEQEKRIARKVKTCTGQKGKPYGAKLKKTVIITVTWSKPEATASEELTGVYSERMGSRCVFSETNLTPNVL